MLTVADFHTHPQHVIEGLRRRGLAHAEALVQQIIGLDEERKAAQAAMDELAALLKHRAQEIGTLLQTGDIAAADAAKEAVKQLKHEQKVLNTAYHQHVADLQEALLHLPNLPHDSVPQGTGEVDNKVIAEQACPALPDALPHWEVAEKYDLIDFELGNKLTGAGFPVYMGAGARLQRALIQFFLDEATQAGYMEIQPPIVVNADSARATGQLPDKEGQMYQLTDGNLYLIPTAEVPVTNLYRGDLLEEGQLPKRHVAYTPCFRREAGSWGSHVRGLNRLHQFDKVELVEIQRPQDSTAALERMLAHAKGLLEKLELPYRVLQLCTGDLPFTSSITYDLEVFAAGQQRWLEVSSVSNMTSYQANRLQLRYRDKDGKKHVLHTLNGSALALPRILAALLENHHTPEGIRIPQALQSYVGSVLLTA